MELAHRPPRGGPAAVGVTSWAGSGGCGGCCCCCCFFLFTLRSFARRFWNQIFTCGWKTEGGRGETQGQ